MDKEILEQIAKRLDEQTRKIEKHVPKRVDALFGGYTLTCEKMGTRRQTGALKARVDESQVCPAALENIIS